MRQVLSLFVLLAGLWAGGMAAAQTDESRFDLAGWAGVASSAQTVIDMDAVPTARLGAVRDGLVAWRAWLLEQQSANAARIETLEGQMAALGPAPDTSVGESEPEEIAARRMELAAALSEARVPGRRATEAFNEANGLISEIDGVIRERETQALLELGPTPLNPTHWGDAVLALTDLTGDVVREVTTRLRPEWRKEELRRGALVTVMLTVVGLFLLVRGRLWMARLTAWIQARRHRRGRIALGFLASLGQVALPLLGIGMLAGAIASTGLLGPKGTSFLRGVIGLLSTCYAALWLVGRLFPASEDLPAALSVSPGLRRRAYRSGLLVGVLVGLGAMLLELSQYPEITRAVAGVLAFPMFLGLSVGFFGLARVFRAAAGEVSEEEATPFGLRAFALAGRALIVVAIVGPVIAAIGYLNLADAIIMPTAITLGLMGLFLAAQAPIRDLYAWASRTSIEDAREALIPVLINFALAILSLPLVALIWGMRPEELGEVLARFNEGIAFGESRLTPGTILSVLIVFGIGFAVTRIFQSAMKSTVLPRTRLDAGARNAVVSFSGYVGIAIAGLLAINAGGIDLTALAVVAGALSVGIGFGLQNVVQNFVAGIILLIERPIGEGDWIEVGGNMGIVKAISVRSTTIETFDKTQVIVPNADFISGTVTNWTRGSQIGRAVIEVGVAYGTDTRRVQEILLEIAKEHPVVARWPEPGVDFTGFGADSLDFRIRAILTDVNQMLGVKTEINHRIAERFAEEGIEIPFAQRDIWLRNPEALRPAPAPASPAPGAKRPVHDGEGAEGLAEQRDDPEDAD